MDNEICLIVDEQDARMLAHKCKVRAEMKLKVQQLEAMASEQERIVDEMEAQLRAKYPAKVAELAELKLLTEKHHSITERVRALGAEMDERN